MTYLNSPKHPLKLRVLLWFFAKRRLTHADFTCFMLAVYVGGVWLIPILGAGVMLCTCIGAAAENWRDVKTGRSL